MLPDKKVKCPYTAFKTTCFDGVTKHGCPKWIQLVGSDPSTGEPINKHGCSDAWLPILLIENAQQSRQTSAAVEDFRNRMIEISGPKGLPATPAKLIAG